MVIVGGICHECHKYYQGDHCATCERSNIEHTLNFIADFHDEYYDHGLGEVVKSRQHRKSLMKDKGVVEVGNEKEYILGNRSADRQRETRLENDFEDCVKEAHQVWKS